MAGILDRFRLDGRVALVTGASSGLGRDIAVALAEAGADVMLAARRADRLAETARLAGKTGRRVATSVTDVADPDSCEHAAAATVAELGRLDILVNCAGLATAVPAGKETPEQFRSVLEVNLEGSYWMAKACAARMGPGASIVNIGSVLGLSTVGLPHAAYSASKAAVLGLTRDLAGQWTGRKGIRVNAVVPGYFPTDMTATHQDGFLDGLADRRIPMRRLGEGAECAAAVVFAAGDASSYMTGSAIVVDGGFLIT
ncbi:SDR family NAD(P)-dependent oxidoreductase [Amycolatopsis jejuensis]|uniref:SDR family NAD(P)-dependent oxidoreductase n=1 Tax=Amycolatopsis jejuensis TaxID=330084 RepID=UPI000524721D|nr:SDR family oxidoreductase [Amycolatopsis jejuensis]